MVFGKLRKIWEKIKGVGRKVWGGLKKVLPIAKPLATAIATGIGGPGAGLATSTAFQFGESAGDSIFKGGGSKNNARLTGLSLGQRLQLT